LKEPHEVLSSGLNPTFGSSNKSLERSGIVPDLEARDPEQVLFDGAAADLNCSCEDEPCRMWVSTIEELLA
jgi:hypothetical protein